jgi:hypothetical protein
MVFHINLMRKKRSPASLTPFLRRKENYLSHDSHFAGLALDPPCVLVRP